MNSYDNTSDDGDGDGNDDDGQEEDGSSSEDGERRTYNNDNNEKFDPSSDVLEGSENHAGSEDLVRFHRAK